MIVQAIVVSAVLVAGTVAGVRRGSLKVAAAAAVVGITMIVVTPGLSNYLINSVFASFIVSVAIGEAIHNIGKLMKSMNERSCILVEMLILACVVMAFPNSAASMVSIIGIVSGLYSAAKLTPEEGDEKHPNSVTLEGIYHEVH